MYDNVHGMGVDPRNIAQRIMDVRITAPLLIPCKMDYGEGDKRKWS